MANTFLTVQDIAEQGLLRLRENEVFSALVWRDFDGEFTAKKGDTVQVRVPNVFDGKDFVDKIQKQDISEKNVLVKLDQIADVSVEVTSKQKTLNLYDYTEQVINPAVEALASKIDRTLAGLYKDIPNFVGTAGTTPSDLKAFAYSAKKLNENNVPLSMRRGVFDPSAMAEFQQLDKFVEVGKSATTETLREGIIGKAIGIDNYMDQNIETHVAGGYTALADVTITAGAAKATSITLTSAAGSSTAKLLKGDIFTLDGKQYVVTEDVTAAAGVATVKIYPALPKAFGDMATKTVAFADVTSAAHTANLVFHRNAFVFVNRPMDADLGGVDAATATFEGLSLRVTKGYDIDTKKEIMSFDILYGVKTVDPRLAVVVLG